MNTQEAAKLVKIKVNYFYGIQSHPKINNQNGRR